jgi:hypothetical protein
MVTTWHVQVNTSTPTLSDEFRHCIGEAWPTHHHHANAPPVGRYGMSVLVGICRPRGLVICCGAQQNFHVANFGEKLVFVIYPSHSACWFVPSFCFPLLNVLADEVFSMELKKIS